MGAQPAEGLALCVAVLVAVGMGPARVGRLGWFLVSMARRLPMRRAAAPRAQGRPIEVIARDAHRLSQRFRYVPEGASFARFEARRLAYDQVLAEACHALDVEHLLEVLPPGSELDAERHRVEAVLGWAGLRLDDVA